MCRAEYKCTVVILIAFRFSQVDSACYDCGVQTLKHLVTAHSATAVILQRYQRSGMCLLF